VISKKDTWYVDDPEIKINNVKIPNIAPEEAFRYLGAKIGPWKGLMSGIIVPELMGTIKRIRKLALKPAQKIELLRADAVERVAEQLQAALIRACNATIPRKKWHNRSVPWWTPELTREKRRTYREGDTRRLRTLQRPDENRTRDGAD
jgi:hypothetical protein